MLIGVGLGPGDPELLTIAAIKALKNSRKVFVPGKLAAQLVAPYAAPEILDFPMIHDKEKLSKLWEDNANIVANEARKGMVSFAVIGDPNIFSTFSHLRHTIMKKYPDIKITTVAGVSVITAHTARTNTSIDSSFMVNDGSPMKTKIILKTRYPEKQKEVLKKEGFDEFIFAEKLFMEGEKVTFDIPEKSEYFSILIAKKGKQNDNKVYFVGAGPGNPKYITVRGKELLESADVVVYAGSLVNPEILNYVHGERINSHGMTLEEIIDIMAEHVIKGRIVVRLHSGDPSLYGAMIEQIDALKKKGIEVEIIPGVTSLFASAASLKKELTLKGVTDTLIITRPSGRTLEKDLIRELSKHNATMAIYLGVHKLREIIDKLEYPKDTPVAVVYHASWDDEKVITGTIENIANKVEALRIERSAMIIIGDVLSPKHYKRSHLYG